MNFKKIDLNQKKKFKGNSKRRSTGFLALGIVGIILIGAVLLMLPISSNEGTFTDPLTALFTAVSSTCVTGLVVVDTATHWSLFGQVVIILLIQIGGLGFMTMAVILSLLLHRTVTPKERMLVAMSYNFNSYESMTALIKRIVLGTVIIEGAGAVLLATQFVPVFGADGIFMSVFHSISAFCNAGFDLMGTTTGKFSSLTYFRGNAVVNITIILLIMIGGIGFVVWNDIVNRIKCRKRMSAYSKLILIVSIAIFVGGGMIFFFAEYNNPKTMGELPLGEKILASLFQSATLRTAGFGTIDNAVMTDVSKLASLVLMFIGGASGSTAGGVKVGSIAVLAIVVWNSAIGKRDSVIFGRKLTAESFTRAVTVIVIQLMLIIVSSVVIMTDMPELDVMAVLFETTSAVNTVGLSFGLSPALSALGKIIDILLMYFGRVGILSITFAVSVNLSERDTAITYPDANMLIG